MTQTAETGNGWTGTTARNLFTTQPARLLYHALRLLLVVVFVWSGVSKGLAPVDFAYTVGAYGLLPDLLILPVAGGLILLELVAGGGLLFDKRGSLTLITLMMVLFLVVLGYGIHLGLDIDCGCFGPDDPEAEAFHDLRGAFRRDLLLLLAIGYLYLWRFFTKTAPRPWLTSRRSRILSQEDSHAR
ncbi:MAG: DoxX family protein [Desulfuromonas sp.]|nr:MAG: DoxX family protein [Desulfuromonas sp.]